MSTTPPEPSSEMPRTETASAADGTRLSASGQARVQDRTAAMAAALRANLQRRKQQLRGRQDEAALAAGVADGDEMPDASVTACVEDHG